MWIVIRLLIGIALLLLVEYYFIKKINLTVKHFFPKFYIGAFRAVKNTLLVWLNLYPIVLIIIFIYFAISGNYVSSPESKIIDYLFVYPFWIFFILIIQVGLFLLLLDLLKLLVLPLYKKNRKNFLRIQSALTFLIIGFFIVYVPIRVTYDYNSVTIRSVEYHKKNLPKVLENFKIAFISDLQTDHYTDENRTDNFIQKVNSTKPDLVLIAGDLITTGSNYIQLSGQKVGAIKSRYGVYSCVGDHDNWAYRNDSKQSIAEIKKSLMKNNVEMIDNETRLIKVSDAQIGITFITNTYVSKADDHILDTLSSSCKGDLKIFLTHQPRPFLIDAAHKNNFDLYLAGHTHGGQVSFIFPFIFLTPTQFETKYVRGDFWFDDMLMIVTRGLGMSLAPIRYNSTPEVTLIVLKNSK